MKFSIIIPVYNAEPFLLKCLDSVFNQKFNYNFEVIAINDASSDGSLNILRKYKKNEDRLIILDQLSNTGQAIARGNGMKIAKGDYIMHLDADDWILESAFEEIYEKIEKYKPDVLILNSYIQNQGKERVLIEYFNFDGFVKKENLDNNNNKIQAAFYQHSGTKIVRREITDNLIVNSDQFETTAEDFLYCFEVFLKSKNIYFFQKAYYVANIHPNSLTQRTESYKQMNNQVILIRLLNKVLTKYYYDEKILKRLLDYRLKASVNLALLCWLNESHNKVNKSDIINEYSLLVGMDAIKLNIIKSSLNNGIMSLYYSFKYRGFLSTIFYVIKFQALKLIQK